MHGRGFYHIKNLQSTKTVSDTDARFGSFITLRIYKVLKPIVAQPSLSRVLSH